MDDDEVGFTTARELHEATDRREADERSSGERDGGASDTVPGTGDEPDGPTFDVEHPSRSHSRAGGMRYEGGTVFALTPDGADDVAAVVEALLDGGPYRYGDWFDLPMPLFLVHDDELGDTFRVAVRDERVELHVRSATSPAGLRAFYERFVERVGEPVAISRKAEEERGG